MKRFARLTALPVAVVLTIALVAGPATAASSDARIAKEGVVVAGDLPAAWTSSPPDNSGDKKELKAATKTSGCKPYVAARKAVDSQPNAESRDFSSNRENVSNKVWVFPSVAKAGKAFAQMSDSTIAGCLTDVEQRLVEQQVAGDKTVKDVHVVVVQATDVPPVGDDIVGYTGGVEVTSTDGTVGRIPLANVIVQVGRSIISYTFSGAPTATGAYSNAFLNTVDSVINVTVGRMQDAL